MNNQQQNNETVRAPVDIRDPRVATLLDQVDEAAPQHGTLDDLVAALDIGAVLADTVEPARSTYGIDALATSFTYQHARGHTITELARELNTNEHLRSQLGLPAAPTRETLRRSWHHRLTSRDRAVITTVADHIRRAHHAVQSTD